MESPAELLESAGIFLKVLFEDYVTPQSCMVSLKLLPCFEVAGLCERHLEYGGIGTGRLLERLNYSGDCFD